MYLIFDTETTGKAKDFKHKPSTNTNWPYIVQLAWLLTDGEVVVEQGNFIIQIGDKAVEKGAEDIHGLSQEYCNKYGVKLRRALTMFADACSKANFIVAHNYNFDSNVVASEMLREGIAPDFLKMTSICTMDKSTDFCKLKSNFGKGYKWPKLIELHKHLFDSEFDGAHNAMVDVEACAKCLFKLIEEGVIEC